MSALFFKRTAECAEIVAADDCRLRELIYPDRDALEIPYSLAAAFIEPGGSTAAHSLSEEGEVYYFLEGSGSIRVGENASEVGAGDVVLVPKGATQSLRNTGDGPLIRSLCSS